MLLRDMCKKTGRDGHKNMGKAKQQVNILLSQSGGTMSVVIRMSEENIVLMCYFLLSFQRLPRYKNEQLMSAQSSRQSRDKHMVD